MKKIPLYIFILLVFAQWLLPGKILWTRQLVVNNGTAYKFQTAPVDPVNPFKGRYVALNFNENSYRAPVDTKLKTGDVVFVSIDTTDKGYAKIKSVNTTAPTDGSDYIKTTVNYINKWDDSTATILQFKYPFDEYYMQEFKAPKAESLYRDTLMDPEKTYALVKIYKGDCVLDGLYINEQPVEALIK